MVSCAINGVPLQMLLDSGAQVTMVGRAWMKKTLPNVQIQPLQSLLFDQPLEILAANGTDVPFEGWADVELQVCSQNYGHVTIQVPVLISKNVLNSPLLGSNVIAEMIKTNQEQRGEADISALLKEALSVSDWLLVSSFRPLRRLLPSLSVV